MCKRLAARFISRSGGSYLRGGDVGGPKSSAKPESKVDRNHLRRQHGNFWFDLAVALGLEIAKKRNQERRRIILPPARPPDLRPGRARHRRARAQSRPLRKWHCRDRC